MTEFEDSERVIEDMGDELSLLQEAITDLTAERDDVKAALNGAIELLRVMTAERDALKQTLHDELDCNLRLREVGGANSDEGMTNFLERVIAENDALRDDAERYRWLRGGDNDPPATGAGLLLHGAALDAAIDAARKA